LLMLLLLLLLLLPCLLLPARHLRRRSPSVHVAEAHHPSRSLGRGGNICIVVIVIAVIVLILAADIAVVCVVLLFAELGVEVGAVLSLDRTQPVDPVFAFLGAINILQAPCLDILV
jgi:ABC-type Fe3+ transport system permease subunit